MLKFGDLKYAYPDPHVCHFCLARIFCIWNWNFARLWDNSLATAWFFLIFLKHINVSLKKQQEHWCLGAKNLYLLALLSFAPTLVARCGILWSAPSLSSRATYSTPECTSATPSGSSNWLWQFHGKQKMRTCMGWSDMI
jgi:hypothetical protein